PRIRRGREHLVHRGQHRVRVPRFAGARESLSGRLGGKVAIVTGGTAGIGEATVRLFVQEGARVVIVARHASGQGDGSTKFVAGVPRMGLYAAARGALLARTRPAAIEWARQGVRVNAVAPGLTRTQLVRTWIDGQPDPAAFERQVVSTIPQGRMAEPEEVASAILFLAGDESRPITGISLAIDGGYT